MFQRLNITDTILDKLGFSDYWDEHGTWGGRTLDFNNGTRFRIIEYEEQEPDFYQNGNQYISNHFCFAGFFAIPKIEGNDFDLFFLHEMYDCINLLYPDCLPEFLEKCNSLGMKIYIDDYLKSLNH